MKTKFYLILLLCATVNKLTAQNLKPDFVSSVNVNIPPTNTDYIGLTKIYIQPNYNEDQRYRSTLAGKINTNVYTIEGTMEASELYFTYDVQRYWKKNTVASSSNSTSTNKSGQQVTTTTYRYDGTEEIRLILRLYQANGVMLSEASDRNQINHSGTSTGSYQAALNVYNQNRDKNNIQAIENLIGTQFDKIANQFLFTSRTVSFYSIGVKSHKQDYSDMNMAAEYMTKWLASNPTDMSSPDVIEANKIYDMALLEYEPDTKKARVDNEIAATIYYEKACMEFILQHYRKAEELILKSEELDGKIHHSQEAMKDVLALMKQRKVFN